MQRREVHRLAARVVRVQPVRDVGQIAIGLNVQLGSRTYCPKYITPVSTVVTISTTSMINVIELTAYRPR